MNRFLTTVFSIPKKKPRRTGTTRRSDIRRTTSSTYNAIISERDVTACAQLQSGWNQRTDSFWNRLPSLLKAVGRFSECTPVLGPLTSNMASSRLAGFLLLLLTLACGLRQGSVMIETLNSDQAVDPNEGPSDEGGGLEQQGGSAEGQRYLVFCGEDAMEVVLPPGSLSEMKVFDSSGMYPVFGLPEACGFSLTRENGRIVLHVHFTGCPVTFEEGSYTLRFLYRNSAGQFEVVTVSCSNSSHTSSSKTRSSRQPVLSYPAVKRPLPCWDPLSLTPGEQLSIPQPDPLPPTPKTPLTDPLLDLLSPPEFNPQIPPPGDQLSSQKLDPLFPPEFDPQFAPPGDQLSSPKLDPEFPPEFDPLFPTPEDPLPTSQWEQLSPTPAEPLLPPEIDPLFPTPEDPLPTSQWEQLSPTTGNPLPTSQWEQLSPTTGNPLPTSQWEQLSPTPTSMPVTAMPSSVTLHSNFKQGGCSFPNGQRLPCGRPGASAAECLRRGCCRDQETFACYYPMDVCLADGQFVFVVPSNVAGLPINPARLMAVGRSSCKPIIANKDFAVFRFGVMECGTRSYRIGETTVYLAEVQSPIRKRILQLMVECRYSKDSLALQAPADSPVLAAPLAPLTSQSHSMKGWASAGYMVKSASLPALVRAKGLYGVQLRISEDETFTKFRSEDHQPLKVLLGKPVYLEVRINAPNPKATLVVHYCVAYPRSAKSALVLLYEGCPNPLDSNISILYVAGQSQDRHVRRFEVKAFQFMDQSTNKYLNEEIYFMCSTEVCMPSQTPCKETCFDGKSSSTTAADVLSSNSQLKVKQD
ncbi:hypothetical protein AOLI_G00321820 [Acnodon oligacanthus]